MNLSCCNKSFVKFLIAFSEPPAVLSFRLDLERLKNGEVFRTFCIFGPLQIILGNFSKTLWLLSSLWIRVLSKYLHGLVWSAAAKVNEFDQGEDSFALVVICSHELRNFGKLALREWILSPRGFVFIRDQFFVIKHLVFADLEIDLPEPYDGCSCSLFRLWRPCTLQKESGKMQSIKSVTLPFNELEKWLYICSFLLNCRIPSLCLSIIINTQKRVG